MSSLSIDGSSNEPKPAETGTNINPLVSNGGSGKICPKFMEYLLSDPEGCELCPHHKDKRACRQYDCTTQIRVCEDTSCPNHLFYGIEKWKRVDNELSRIARNCIHGIHYLLGPMTLDEIASIYGVTRERIRQVETVAKIRLGKQVVGGQEFRHLVTHKTGLNHFGKLVQYKARWDHMKNQHRVLRKTR